MTDSISSGTENVYIQKLSDSTHIQSNVIPDDPTALKVKPGHTESEKGEPSRRLEKGENDPTAENKKPGYVEGEPGEELRKSEKGVRDPTAQISHPGHIGIFSSFDGYFLSLVDRFLVLYREIINFS